MQANPTTNYHAFQYPDYRQGYKVVYTRGTGHGIASRAPGGLGPTVLTETHNRGIESHQLAQLKGLARSNGAAGELARARLAELGEPIPDFRIAKGKKRSPKAPADSAVPTPNGTHATALMPPVPTAPPAMTAASAAPPATPAATPPAVGAAPTAPATTAPAVPAAATMPAGTTPPAATVGAALPAAASRTRTERVSRLPHERVRLQRDSNTRSPFAGVYPAKSGSTAPKLSKKKKKTTRSQLFGTAKATLQSRNQSAMSQLFVPLYAAPFLGSGAQERLTKPKRSGLIRGGHEPSQAMDSGALLSESVPVDDDMGASVPMDHVPEGGLAAVGVPMEEGAHLEDPHTVPPLERNEHAHMWGQNEHGVAGLGVQSVPTLSPQAAPPYEARQPAVPSSSDMPTVPPYAEAPRARVPTSANAYAPLSTNEAYAMPTSAPVPAPAPIPLPEPVPSVMPATASSGADVQRLSSMQHLPPTQMPGANPAEEAFAIRSDKRASLLAARDGTRDAESVGVPPAGRPVRPAPEAQLPLPRPVSVPTAANVPVQTGAVVLESVAAPPVPPKSQAPMTRWSGAPPTTQALAQVPETTSHTPWPHKHAHTHAHEHHAHPGLEPLTQQISYAEPVPEAAEEPLHAHHEHPHLERPRPPVSYVDRVPEAVEVPLYAHYTPAPPQLERQAQPVSQAARVPEAVVEPPHAHHAHPGLEPLTQQISYAEPVPEAAEEPLHAHQHPHLAQPRPPVSYVDRVPGAVEKPPHVHHAHPHLERLTQPLSYAEPMPEAVETRHAHHAHHAHPHLERLTQPLSYAEPVPETVVSSAEAPASAQALAPPLSHEILSRIPVTSLDPEPVVQQPAIAEPALAVPQPASLPYLSSQRTLVSPAGLSTTVLPARESVQHADLSSLAPLAEAGNMAGPSLSMMPAVHTERRFVDEFQDATHLLSIDSTAPVGLARQDEAMAHRDAVLSRARADDMERQWAEFEAQCRLNREAGLPPPSLLR